MKRTEVIIAADRSYAAEREKNVPISCYFGEDTFSTRTMQEKLPAAVFHRLQDTTLRGKKLDLETANAVAHAMKEWAIEKGATHYCHWFQPMTGSTAEKHDAFIEFTDEGEPIERFSGKQLVQGEPDASSFPSGGIRSTFEARGYTAWDISSPAFILKRGIGTALCIPSVFISYSGEALDKKTPLLRSIEAINTSALNLLRVLGNRKARKVYATLGPEQEYFLIDQDYFYKRQDLLLSGRALLGAAPPKGQELEDHYFGSIKERIFSFMHDVEEELYKLGIPAKTRHNEVAPSQYELAPLFEEANLAVDHNQILMEAIRSVATKHKLAALLHEKPFAGINGSGKHLNWSLADDQGNNLLNPGKTPQDNIQFLVFLVATIRAVYYHADILRAAVASSGNDHRLGANEAPPAIISVFLGEQLSGILEDIEKGVVTNGTNGVIIDMGISKLPLLSKDNTDRNRTSPFAFTGNKFEFRAVGSSQSISFPATVLNTIVAESLDVLAEKITAKGENTRQATLDVLKEEIKAIKNVLFMGDNYSKEWEAEASRRGLPNKKTSYESFPDMASSKAIALFEKYRVLSPVELKSRYHVRLERYVKEIDIEAGTLCNMVECQVLPAAIRYQKDLASSITLTAQALGSAAALEPQKAVLSSLVELIGSTRSLVAELKKTVETAESLGTEEEKATAFGSKVRSTMNAIRAKVDEIELMIDDEIWPLPRFWEMLFIK